LRDQSDPDYEQIFIIDDIGQGLHAANRALALPAVEGAYVLVLDDDDRLADPDAVALLKEATENEPELLFFRADHDQLGILPDDKVWQRRPLHGRVGSCDFITRSDIWQRFVAHFAMPESGDFNFLHAVWESGPSVSWLDRQLAAVQRISKGAPE
jgi:glycosyltransferase involved in cell wall biosynthesis